MSDHDAAQPRTLWTLAARAARWRDRLLLKGCKRATAAVTHGQLRLTLPSGESALLGRMAGTDGEPEAALTLPTLRPVMKAVARGSIGFAEAYMAGEVRTPDLAALLRFYVVNKRRIDAAGRGQFKVRAPDRFWHKLRANSRLGSRRNIAAHYDLGNEFYAAWLDRSMTYSSALYHDGVTSLEDAQQAKLERIIEALDVRPGMRVLEIGCGWGALAEKLGELGCRVTAATISEAQLGFARERIAAAGLAGAVDVLAVDYRDIEGRFDRIVSVEMIEAVGEDHWQTYFDSISRLLEPGGVAVLQAITIDEPLFAAYRAKADFIQRYIFPGGMLPTPSAIGDHAARAGMAASTLVLFGPSYAETLRAWRQRFDAAWARLSEMGFDLRFRRMWTYYFVYCEVGFDAGMIDVGLYRLEKAAADR